MNEVQNLGKKEGKYAKTLAKIHVSAILLSKICGEMFYPNL